VRSPHAPGLTGRDRGGPERAVASGAAPGHVVRLVLSRSEGRVARAMWKAVIRLGGDDDGVPVKLYSAAQDRSIHFRLLHAADEEPVKQRMVHADSGDEVPYEEARKGFEVDKGVYVILEAQDLTALEPEPSRDIELLTFLPAGTIPAAYYDRPYWLGPDGDEKAYFALVRALEKKGSEGIARWTLRKRSHVGALRLEQGYLALDSLRHADEVVRLEELDAPGGRALDRKEVQLAERLVAALEDRFDPAAFEDDYRARVLDLVKRKAKGEAIELRRPKRKKVAKSLTTALEESLRKAKESRVA
jgi:DNA end-binding protein Ku